MVDKTYEELKKAYDELNDFDNSQAKKLLIEVKDLKERIGHYKDIINRLMGTPLTDTNEIGRLIEMAQYENWELEE